MSSKRYVHGLVWFTMILGAIVCARAQSSQNVRGLSVDRLELRNVKAETVNYKGRAAVRLIDTGAPDLGHAGRLAIIRGSSFTDGTIEIDLTGDTAPHALESLRGFVGVSFRVAADASRFECFYLRPKMGALRTKCSGTTRLSTSPFRDFPGKNCVPKAPGSMNPMWI